MSACGGSYSREIRRHFFINGPQWTAAYGGQVLFLASGTSTATCGPSGAPRSNSSSALGLCTKDSRLAQSRSSLSLISKVFTMSVVHIFRLIQCKTCASKIDIEYLGPSVDVRIAGTISNPGHLRCPKCGDSHKYSGSDIPLLHQGSRASPGALVAP
jgi:hypothetical protein